jgi:hypothetical protein
MEITEYKYTAAASSAMQRFANVLAGKNDKSMVGQLALMHMRDTAAKNSAEVKQIVRRSKDLISSIDLQQAVYDAKAFEYLAEYDQKYLGTSTTKATPVTFTSVEERQASNYDNL